MHDVFFYRRLTLHLLQRLFEQLIYLANMLYGTFDPYSYDHMVTIPYALLGFCTQYDCQA
jgi:hypothetical protein